jgi:hypothetical protein
MALETTIVFETSVPVPLTCADGTAIAKGALLTISDPFTVATTTGDTDPIIGIAAESKVAGDGVTKIPVYMTGIFKGYAGAAGVTVGQAIISDTGTGAANELVNADVDSEHIVGRALETATDGQTFLFQLNPFSVNLAV